MEPKDRTPSFHPPSRQVDPSDRNLIVRLFEERERRAASEPETPEAYFYRRLREFNAGRENEAYMDARGIDSYEAADRVIAALEKALAAEDP